MCKDAEECFRSVLRLQGRRRKYLCRIDYKWSVEQVISMSIYLAVALPQTLSMERIYATGHYHGLGSSHSIHSIDGDSDVEWVFQQLCGSPSHFWAGYLFKNCSHKTSGIYCRLVVKYSDDYSFVDTIYRYRCKVHTYYLGSLLAID